MITVKYSIQEGGRIFTLGEWDLTPTQIMEQIESKLFFDTEAIPIGPKFIKLTDHCFVFGVFLFKDGSLVAKIYAAGTTTWS